jgi:hypothetical protein
MRDTERITLSMQRSAAQRWLSPQAAAATGIRAEFLAEVARLQAGEGEA